MKNVSFGLDQISKRTPAFARWAFRAVLYITAAINLILTVVVEIPEPVRILIAKYSLYAVTLVHGFSKLFGVPVDDINNPQNPNA